MLVGVTGRAQHGKDTIGRVLVEEFGFVRYGFADGVRELALRVNPYIDGEAGDGSLQDLVTCVGWEEAKRTPEVRRFLQELGTGARDVLGLDVWVRALELRWLLEGHERVVVTDVRFWNEAEWVHKHGGMLVRVTRLTSPYCEPDCTDYEHPFEAHFFEAPGVDPEHASERYVPELPADYDILNDGDPGQLYDRTRDFILSVLRARREHGTIGTT